MLGKLFKLPKLAHEVVYRLTGFVIVQNIDPDTKRGLSFYIRNLWVNPFHD